MLSKILQQLKNTRIGIKDIMADVRNICNLIGREEHNNGRNVLSGPVMYIMYSDVQCLWWTAAILKK